MDSISREFGNWFEENKISGLDGYGKSADYVAESDLRKYWSSQRICTIWSREVTKQLPIPVDSIKQDYLRIFSTLVYIARQGRPSLVYLENFNKWNIHDNNVLPHFEQDFSRIFSRTPEGKEVSETFKNTYFRFNPVVFGAGLHRTELSPLCILPMTFKEKISGDSVVINKYEPHAAAGIESSEKVIVVKEYPQYELEGNFKNEANAYISLINTAGEGVVSKYFLKYHGSFIQNQKGYILLEYANEGSLLDFFRHKCPPYTREKALNLWKNLFELLLGLNILHDHDPIITTKQLRGVHQDLKPANIFVFREQSHEGYQYKFKIGDFGLTSFEFFDRNSNKSPDNKGGTMYSPPELTHCHEDTRYISDGITEEADMWSFACVLFEFAVWSICGEEGRDEFWELRCQEISQHPLHVNQGYGASFHDGLQRITAVDNMLDDIIRRRRVFDDFTERICMILLDQVLVPRTKIRCRAKELYPLLNNALNGPRSLENSPTERLPESAPLSQPVSAASVRSKPSLKNSLPPLICSVDNQQNFVNSPSSMNGNEYPNLFWGHSSSMTHSGLGQQILKDHVPIKRAHSLGAGKRAGHLQDGSSAYMWSGCQNHTEGTCMLPYCTQTCTSQCYGAKSHPGPPVPTGVWASHTLPVDPRESHQKEDNGIIPRVENIANSGQYAYSGDLRERLRQSPPPSRVDYPPLLVEQMLRWLDSGRKTELQGLTTALGLLKKRDQIFIIDDSASMRKHHWEKTIDTFRALGYPASQVDPDGIELYFTSKSDKVHKSLRNRFSKGEPKSLVDLVIDRGKKVGENICHMELSLSIILEKVKRNLSSRETSIYILTDAMWDDPTDNDFPKCCGVDNPIRSLVKEMRNQNIMRTHVSLQFIRFGDNAVSKRRLRYLDNDLGKELQFDIVDYRNHNSSVWNMLLGGVIAAIDAIDDDHMQNNNTRSRSATLQELGFPEKGNPFFLLMESSFKFHDLLNPHF